MKRLLVILLVTALSLGTLGNLPGINPTSLSTVVPYSGATTDVDLGLHYLSGTYYVSTVATGTAPFQCTSETVNTHLNADLLDGHSSAYFQTALTTGSLTADYLQSAAADLGAANVTVNLANSNGAYVTNVSTDGTITATAGFYGALTGNVTGNVTGNCSGNAATVTNGIYNTDTGTVTADMLQAAAADLGAADVTVNLGNTNGAFNTNITTDGTITATGGFSGALTGNVTGDCSGNAGTVTNGVYTTDTGTVTADMLQAAAADLGDADIGIDLSNTNAGNVTTLTIDGAMTAKSMVFENAESITNENDGTLYLRGISKLDPRLNTPIYNTDGSETLTAALSGAMVVATKSDGATTVTIPDPTADTVGVMYYIMQTADQNLILTCETATSDGIVCDGVATSDNVSITTAGHLIGAGMFVLGIKTGAATFKWYVGGLNPDSPLTPEAAD